MLRFALRSLRIAAVSVTLLSATLAPLEAAQAANAPPTISGWPPSKGVVGSLYSFTPKASDPEGATLSFSIWNKPGWASFSSTTGRLSGTPTTTGTWSEIQIKVTDGNSTAYLARFSITVTANRAPTISGTPPTSVKAGSYYSFQPTASDPDGQKLTFSISGKPAWASFSTSTGKLYGTPASTLTGTFSNIVIKASDGKLSKSLPAFSITVTASTTTTNRAPTITGTPVKSATVGQPYSFKPTASDADGDPLTFSIANKPAWASFDTSNGTLYGTPTTAGTSSSVTISVSDGKATASLAAFSIQVLATGTGTATVGWVPPTKNADGTAITGLTGYQVWYGTTPNVYTASLEVSGASTNSVVIEGLAPGTYYFAVKAVNSSGSPSDFSSEVSKTL
jgi:hypothetical protein